MVLLDRLDKDRGRLVDTDIHDREPVCFEKRRDNVLPISCTSPSTVPDKDRAPAGNFVLAKNRL